MAEETTKQATLEMVITNENGQQIKKKLTGTNGYIGFILEEAGILSKDIEKILNAE